MGRTAGGAETARGLQPVDLGHLHVHENDIVGGAFDGLQDIPAVGGGVGAIAEPLQQFTP